MAAEGTALRELLATFGFRVDTAALTTADQSLTGLIASTARFGQLLVGGVVASGIGRWIQSTIDAGSELHDMSEQTGLSATELTEWRYAARLAGVEASQLNSAMGRTALAAAHGSPVLRHLGVQTHGAGGELRRASDIFEDAGVAIAGLTNDTARQAAATQLWGRSGRALIPMFAAGLQGVAELRAEVRRLYGTDLEQLAEQSDRAGDAQDHFNLVLDALSTRLAVSVLPWITSFLEAIANGASRLAQLAASSNVVQATLVLLGGIAVAAALATIGSWGPPLALFALVAAAVGVVILVVDDLITLFHGGHSVIGEFIDELFGIGTAAEWVQGLTEAWEGLTLSIQNAGVVAHEFLDGFGSAVTDLIGGNTDGPQGAQGAFDQDQAQRAEIARQAAAITERERAAFVTAGGTLPSSSTRAVQVGAIHIDGARDPVETGRAVRDHIEELGDTNADDTAHDLGLAVPT